MRRAHKGTSGARARGLILLAALACAACKREHAPSAAPDASVSAVDAAAAPAASLTRPRTTSGAIAVDNLGAEISALDARAADPASRVKLVSRLLSRAQFLGGVDDFARAEREALEAVKLAPTSADAHMALAAVHAAVHRSERAEASLARAAKLGAAAERVAQRRAELALAVGRYDDADAQTHDAGAGREGARELTFRAVLAAHMQRMDASERLFALARERFDDVSPFLLAWMDVERAQVYELTNRGELARLYYAEACEVLPAYVHATVHLAAMEGPERALERLRALPSQEDPEVLGALAAAQARGGDAEGAGHTAELARARYKQALEAFPEAFADHAARFYLTQDRSADHVAALELSRAEAKRRRTVAALDLWMGAATATDSARDLCDSATALLSLAHLDAPRRVVAETAKKRCAAP